jgi:hypothetical protein
VIGYTVVNKLLLFVMPADLWLQPLSYCSVCTVYTKSVFVSDADRTERGVFGRRLARRSYYDERVSKTFRFAKSEAADSIFQRQSRPSCIEILPYLRYDCPAPDAPERALE